MILEPITFKDYRRLLPFFDNQRYRLCSYSLPSIIAWSNDNYRPYAAVNGESVIIAAEFSIDVEKRHLILPVSPTAEHSPEDLAALCEATGYACCWFVPAGYIKTWGRDRVARLFDVQLQTEYIDYVYNSRDLADLKGNKYAKKRNLIKQFERRYVEPGRVTVEPIRPKNVPECLVFLERWCEAMDCGDDVRNDLACEKIAAIHTLNHIADIEARGLLLRIDGAVCGFGMGAGLTADMGVLNFEKAYPDIKGLYQYLDRTLARVLFSDYAFINKESDMGTPGLAKAKKSYHPVELVDSFMLVRK